MAFAVIVVVALVLAPGIQSAVVQTGDLPRISNYPLAIENIDQVQTLPELIDVPIFRPLPLPVPAPEIALPELRPEPIGNPCDACFSYMTALIDQLTEVSPEIQPHPMPEVEVIPETEIQPHPMPEVEVIPETEIQPHPMPVPEVEIQPHPLPVPEVEIQPLPLPVPEVEIQPHPLPEVEIQPLPEFLPVAPETRPLPIQPEIRPLPLILDQ